MIFDKLDSSIFDNLLDGVVLLNSDHQFVYCNLAFARMLDVNHRRLKPGQNFFEHFQTNENFLAHLDWEYLLQEPSNHKEIAFTKKGDSEPSKTGVSFRVLPAESNQKLLLIYFHDVTIEERLHKKYKVESQQKEEYIKKLNRKLFELSFLLDVSSLQNNQTQNFASQIDFILQKLLNTFKLEIASFFSFDEKNKSLNLQSYKHSELVSYQNVRKEFNSFVEENKEKAISSLEESLIYSYKIENREVFVFPLKGRNNLFGTLFLKSSTEDALALETYQELIHSMVVQLGVRLENVLLYNKSITDEMTSLFNNRYFKFSLENEIQKCSKANSKFSLVMIDVDHFKSFNDSYGHQTGDLVLIAVAQEIKEACRLTDIPARYGGEEFAVILIETDQDGAYKAAERIRQFIQQKLVQTEAFGALKVTASLGISVYPDHGPDLINLVEAADKALYKAKHAGRNNTQIYSTKNMEETA